MAAILVKSILSYYFFQELIDFKLLQCRRVENGNCLHNLFSLSNSYYKLLSVSILYVDHQFCSVS